MDDNAITSLALEDMKRNIGHSISGAGWMEIRNVSELLQELKARYNFVKSSRATLRQDTDFLLYRIIIECMRASKEDNITPIRIMNKQLEWLLRAGFPVEKSLDEMTEEKIWGLNHFRNIDDNSSSQEAKEEAKYEKENMPKILKIAQEFSLHQKQAKVLQDYFPTDIANMIPTFDTMGWGRKKSARSRSPRRKRSRGSRKKKSR